MIIKRLIGTLAITAAITALTVTAGAAPALHIYPSAAEILEIDNDLVICSDGAENLWAFWGSEDYETGDIVALIMDSRGTPDIRDDCVVAVRYVGNFSNR